MITRRDGSIERVGGPTNAPCQAMRVLIVRAGLSATLPRKDFQRSSAAGGESCDKSAPAAAPTISSGRGPGLGADVNLQL